ncbi:hypothetical protein EDB92DRAFT_1234630 [Lactarius akahatsu]|uniref:Uncharacterized protein n=1 Tax=Lactarius akahatsu TaxID=416441 RepID=A0AAD4LAL1_9AGAM|nr:hypothetical protein EDB92DRAFT_1234630 [Lactarius akahatsu]
MLRSNEGSITSWALPWRSDKMESERRSALSECFELCQHRSQANLNTFATSVRSALSASAQNLLYIREEREFAFIFIHKSNQCSSQIQRLCIPILGWTLIVKQIEIFGHLHLMTDFSVKIESESGHMCPGNVDDTSVYCPRILCHWKCVNLHFLSPDLIDVDEKRLSLRSMAAVLGPPLPIGYVFAQRKGTCQSSHFLSPSIVYRFRPVKWRHLQSVCRPVADCS